MASQITGRSTVCSKLVQANKQQQQQQQNNNNKNNNSSSNNNNKNNNNKNKHKPSHCCPLSDDNRPTGDRWIPLTKSKYWGKRFHVMPSCSTSHLVHFDLHLISVSPESMPAMVTVSWLHSRASSKWPKSVGFELTGRYGYKALLGTMPICVHTDQAAVLACITRFYWWLVYREKTVTKGWRILETHRLAYVMLLQMSWRQTGTSPSTATMPTLQWFNNTNGIWIMLRNMHISWQPLNKQCSREIGNTSVSCYWQVNLFTFSLFVYH